MNWYIIVWLAIPPTKQSEHPGALLTVLPTGRIALHQGPSELAQC